MPETFTKCSLDYTASFDVGRIKNKFRKLLLQLIRASKTLSEMFSRSAKKNIFFHVGPKWRKIMRRCHFSISESPKMYGSFVIVIQSWENRIFLKIF